MCIEQTAQWEHVPVPPIHQAGRRDQPSCAEDEDPNLRPKMVDLAALATIGLGFSGLS